MARATSALELTVGLLIVAGLLYDVVQTVVVPRWTSRRLRLAPLVSFTAWRVWRWVAFRMRSASRQENFLAAFAPLVLLFILFCWTVGLILGFGLALHALGDQLRPPSPGYVTCFYFSGTCLFTIGFGDVVAAGGPARALSLAAGVSGLALVAMVFAFLFTVHGAFQRREAMVLLLDTRAGAPPSGVELLAVYGRLELRDDLPVLFWHWERWTAELLESHLAYPLLPYFRSSHQGESWVSALGAVLDAATLLLTTVDEGPQGAARLMYGLGVHAVGDLSYWLPRTARDALEVQRFEFEEARQRLSAAGYRLRDAEVAWRAFQQMRAAYAAGLNTLAHTFETPPAQWIGDRSSIVPLHDRE